MSSSNHKDQRAFFLLLSGVVPWEDHAAEKNGGEKTLTICAATLPLLTTLFRSVVVSLRSEATQLFRWHVVHSPPWRNEIQRRRGLEVLRKNPPGFVNTVVVEKGDKLSCVALLSNIDEVNLEYLSSYRDTLVVVPDPSTTTSSDSVGKELGSFIGELDATALHTLATALPNWDLIRVLEMETHAVFQIIGRGPILTSALETMMAQGILRIVDSKDIPNAIATW